MILADMPRKMPIFVTKEKTRHGKRSYYFRRGKGKRTRLPDLGTPGFDAAYQALLAGQPLPGKHQPPIHIGSLAWLVGQYRVSAEYRALSAATRRQRDNIFTNVLREHGPKPFSAITTNGLRQSLQTRASTPAAARNFLRTMRGLFVWAEKHGHRKDNPTAGIESPKQPKTAGFRPWTLDDVTAYERRWAAGTKERVWLHVLLYTGLRRGDAVVIGHQHAKDGMAVIRTEKSGHEVEAMIPIREQLAATIAAGPTGDLAWICGARGEPLTKESFGNLFRDACTAAGVKKSAHGLRKLAAAQAAEAGLTVSELDAIFGWEGGRMASHYTKSANRRTLARQAAGKMENAIPRTLERGAGMGANSAAISTPKK